MSKDKIFADGFRASRRDRAPDFVVCSLGINVEQARQTFKDHVKDGWLNLQVMRSRSGSLYVEVDTWEPGQRSAPADDEAPF